MSLVNLYSIIKRFLLISIYCFSISCFAFGTQAINDQASQEQLITGITIPQTNSLSLIKAPSLIVTQVYEINDDYIGNSYGDADNLVDAGETIELRLEIENTGDETVTNLYGNISTLNPYVELLTYNQSYIQLTPGQLGVTTSYYVIRFNSKLNISDEIFFSIYFTSSEGTWSDTFSVTIMGIPEPVFYGHLVYNENNGDLNADDDGVIDPGEIVYVELFVENIGEAILFDLDGYISSSDPFVTITDDFGSFGSIEGNGDYDYGYFAFSVSGACPIQYHLPFNLSLVDKFDNYWNMSIELVASGYPEYELVNITYIEYTGDDDDFIDAGETWYAEITIRNIGDAIGANVQVSINSNESFVDFYYDSDRDYSFYDLEAGFSETKVTSYYWRFTILDGAMVGSILDFFLLITDETKPTPSRINTTIEIMGSADYQIIAFQLTEDCYYESDCYGVIAAGGYYETTIVIQNIGEAIGNDVVIFLYTNDIYVDFYYGNGSSYDYGTLPAGLPFYVSSYYYWSFYISERAKAGHVLDFTIVIQDASNNEWHFPVSIVVVDGPNTFYHTKFGKAVIFGGSLLFLLFLSVSYIKNKKKQSPGGFSFKNSFDNFKDKLADKRHERNTLREQKLTEREVLRQQRERERIARINENEAQLLEKFESILDMSESVNLEYVSKSLGLSKTQLFEKLIQWQDILPFKIDGEMIEVEDTDDFSQSIREKIAEVVKYYSCSNCGFPIERNSHTCPDCKTEIKRCSVCKLPISFGDDIGQCTLCDAKGHLTHMQEWIKTQGKCPRCLQKISQNDMITIQSEDSKEK